jgi:C-5 cytosine-specific DNA methylase
MRIMQIFFVGWHQPVSGKSGCGNFNYCMISANRLINRVSWFPVQNWAMDSGAFTLITSGKGHIETQAYANLIDRFYGNGNLMFVVSQDYMCESFVLAITGLTIQPIWAIEKDKRITKVHAANFEHHLWVGDVLDAVPSGFAKPDLFWVSQPCVRASSANPQRGESPLDLSLARKICEFVETLSPPQFILENVEGYKRFNSFRAIVERLFSLGFWANWEVLDAADFGVPQNRRRLILRAARGGFLPELPRRRMHRGWGEVVRIEDCIQKPLPQRAIDKLPSYPPRRPSLLLCSGKRSQLRSGVSHLLPLRVGCAARSPCTP